MNVEIGDRVRVGHEMFPEDHVTNLGWENHENGPGWGAPIDAKSREHWQDAHGVVVGLDTLNDEVIVRGKHKGADYTLIVPESHVEILEQGVPR